MAQAHRALRSERAEKKYGFFDLHKDKSIIGQVDRAAKDFSKIQHQNLVVLGIGGSALGTTALVTALKAPYYNLLSKEERGGRPRIFVMDNVDPETFHQMMRLCPPEKTLYNVISKSGGTAETIAQLLIVVEMLEKAVGASALKDHLAVTTGPLERGTKPNPLQALAKKRGLVSFEVPANVGGRFSVFSPVGLFPAAVLGMDLKALFAGCASMDRQCSRASLKNNPAYLRAAVEFFDQHLYPIRFGNAIRIGKRDHIPLCHPRPRVARLGRTAVLLPDVTGATRPRDPLRPVRRAVVHHNHFRIGIALRETPFQAFAKRPLRVVGRNDDRDKHGRCA